MTRWIIISLCIRCNFAWRMGIACATPFPHRGYLGRSRTVSRHRDHAPGICPFCQPIGILGPFSRPRFAQLTFRPHGSPWSGNRLAGFSLPSTGSLTSNVSEIWGLRKHD